MKVNNSGTDIGMWIQFRIISKIKDILMKHFVQASHFMRKSNRG